MYLEWKFSSKFAQNGGPAYNILTLISILDPNISQIRNINNGNIGLETMMIFGLHLGQWKTPYVPSKNGTGVLTPIIPAKRIKSVSNAVKASWDLEAILISSHEPVSTKHKGV